jgi:uncharacterized membrane protein (UPF0182 family)
MRVIDVLDEQTQGPGQVANAMRSDSGAADLLAPFRQAGNSVTYGNVLTIPVGERLLNVEPVYAERGGGATGSYPILRYVLVSYQDQVGIGVTLIEALGDALGVDASNDPTDPVPGGDDNPPPDDPGTPSGTVEEQIEFLLAQAQALFDEADEALADNDLGLYQDKVNEARDKIEQALELADAESGTPSEEPSPSE